MDEMSGILLGYALSISLRGGLGIKMVFEDGIKVGRQLGVFDG